MRIPSRGHRLPDGRRRPFPVMIFFSAEEKAQVDKEAEAAGMPRATYMRWRLLYGGRVPRAAKRAVTE